MTFSIDSNPTAWGPMLTSVPPGFEDIPFAPFSKSDKIGRVADWYEIDDGKDGRPETTNRSRFDRRQPYGATASVFSYVHQEDEASFSLVDRNGAALATRAVTRTQTHGKGGKTTISSSAKTSVGAQRVAVKSAPVAKPAARRPVWAGQERVKHATLAIKSDWRLIEEYPMSALNKLNYEVAEPAVVGQYGSVGYYDRTLDRMTTKLEKPLPASKLEFPDVTVSEDPVMKKIVESGQLPSQNKTLEGDYVFATAQVLAALMAAPRSFHQWDIVVTKVGPSTKDADSKARRIVYFDKRHDSALDFPSVNEISADPPTDVQGDKDNINSPLPLAVESATAARNFSQKILQQGQNYEFDGDDPFADGDNVASCGYHYHRWKLGYSKPPTGDDGGKPITLITRSTIDAAVYLSSEKTNMLTARALTEYYPVDASTGLMQPSYTDWRTKLDNQRGAVLVTELRNNAFKIARWTLESLLANADQMKLGFVTRAAPVNPARGHVLLGVQTYNPRDLAAQINLDMTQGWGIVKSLVDIFMHFPEGRYLLVRDAAQPKLKVYDLPPSTHLPGLNGDATGEEA